MSTYRLFAQYGYAVRVCRLLEHTMVAALKRPASASSHSRVLKRPSQDDSAQGPDASSKRRRVEHMQDTPEHVARDFEHERATAGRPRALRRQSSLTGLFHEYLCDKKQCMSFSTRMPPSDWDPRRCAYECTVHSCDGIQYWNSQVMPGMDWNVTPAPGRVILLRAPRVADCVAK